MPLSLFLALAALAQAAPCVMPPGRPLPILRKFVSASVDAEIASLVPRFKDPNLAVLFSNTLPNTLDTTVYKHTVSPLDTFIVTGDIEAMWQRDSTNQVWPYLRFLSSDAPLRTLVAGLIRRQIANTLAQPYANAFQIDNSTVGPHAGDASIPAGAASSNYVFEYKYELDSLANVLRLSAGYWAATQDTSPFDSTWLAAVQLILATMRDQQQGSEEEDLAGGPAYGFQRTTSEPSDSLDHLRGPVARRTGMVKAAFRGSDDAQVLPFSIPENAYAAVALGNVTALLAALGHSAEAAAATALAADIRAGIAQYGIMQHPIAKVAVYAYEVDGFGSQYFMDDANIPSLMAMPYYGFVEASDALYQQTRAALLSGASNPYYMCGTAGCGIGGPHNGWPYVWPMAIAIQSWTASSDAEVAQTLQLLVNSSACTGFIHESFDSEWAGRARAKGSAAWQRPLFAHQLTLSLTPPPPSLLSLPEDDVNKFTRKWFAWVNSLFADLVMKIAKERPHLIFA